MRYCRYLMSTSRVITKSWAGKRTHPRDCPPDAPILACRRHDCREKEGHRVEPPPKGELRNLVAGSTPWKRCLPRSKPENGQKNTGETHFWRGRLSVYGELVEPSG